MIPLLVLPAVLKLDRESGRGGIARSLLATDCTGVWAGSWGKRCSPNTVQGHSTESQESNIKSEGHIRGPQARSQSRRSKHTRAVDKLLLLLGVIQGQVQLLDPTESSRDRCKSSEQPAVTPTQRQRLPSAGLPAAHYSATPAPPSGPAFSSIQGLW